MKFEKKVNRRGNTVYICDNVVIEKISGRKWNLFVSELDSIPSTQKYFASLKEAKEWNESNLIKVFEIPVIRKSDNQPDYILFDIEMTGNELIAQHEPLTFADESSDKVAHKSVELDDTFSLDEHLQELYSLCETAVMHSDFVDLDSYND